VTPFDPGSTRKKASKKSKAWVSLRRRGARHVDGIDQSPRGNIMKSVTALCLVMFACSVHGAMAQEKKLPPVDFSTMTCEQFWEKTTPNDRGPFLFWLSGYFGHKNNSPVLDPVGFTEKTKALSQFCSRQPNDSILTAADKAFAN
jgi:hypothetical protein